MSDPSRVVSVYEHYKHNLVGVHPSLVGVVELAKTYSPLDFGVVDGVRTMAEEEANLKKGTTTTLNSMHLPQKDGFAHAVDLVPVKDGGLVWDWALIYILASSVRRAAVEKAVHLRWGGAWDVAFTASLAAPSVLSADYAARRKKLGRRVFLDGPHFELVGP